MGFRLPVEFPIEGEKCLAAGMKQEEDDIARHLAFCDFQDLAVGAAARRKEIFSISDPGRFNQKVISNHWIFIFILPFSQEATHTIGTV